MKKVNLKMVGLDGNAFAIMGAFQTQARRDGWSQTEIKEVLDKAMSGKPSAKKIPCTVTGKMVTCFGQNLQAKIKKYGSVEALLEGFVSRGAKKA